MLTEPYIVSYENRHG